MVKGVAIRIKSYEETVPELLKLIKFDEELKKHEKVVLKPNLLTADPETATKPEFVEEVLKFCMEHKNPGTELFIVEGMDGHDTTETFDDLGYTKLAEKYGIGLVDLNNTETEEISSNDFLEFESIHYPTLLKDSFCITLPLLRVDDALGIAASLDTMRGAFPAKHYKGFLSKTKNKLNKYATEYQIHDVIQCAMPSFTIIDGSERGVVLAGQPLEMDKQGAKALGVSWEEVQHLKLIDTTLNATPEAEEAEINALIGE